MGTMNLTALLKGVRSGLFAPFTAFDPTPVRTRITLQVLEPSYRPHSEDRLHIQSYFSKAVDNAREEINIKKKGSYY